MFLTVEAVFLQNNMFHPIKRRGRSMTAREREEGDEMGEEQTAVPGFHCEMRVGGHSPHSHQADQLGAVRTSLPNSSICPSIPGPMTSKEHCSFTMNNTQTGAPSQIPASVTQAGKWPGLPGSSPSPTPHPCAQPPLGARLS